MMNFTEEQFNIINSNADQIRVIATPGSGKTTTTVARIINNKNILPENIFVFCFARGDKEALIRKLQSSLDRSVVSRMFINNYHGFSLSLLRQFGIYDKPGKEIKLLEENESTTFIKKELEDVYKKQTSSPKDVEFLIKKAKRLSVPSIVFNIFDILRDEYVLKLSDADQIYSTKLKSAEDFIEEKVKAINEMSKKEDTNDNEISFDPSSFNIITVKDIVHIAKAYAKFCKSHGYVDFMDMILQAYYLLKENPMMLERISAQIEYLHVDEFQDISHLQFELVSLITSAKDRIFAVGDMDQTLFEFRNANPYFIKEGLPERYKKIETYPLSLNFRSDANIVKAADNLIQNNIDRLPIKLQATFPAIEPIVSKKVNSVLDQATAVADLISELLGDESNYYVEKDHKIAIIVRSARSVSANLIRNALFKKRIPVQLKFESKIVEKIMNTVCAVSNLIMDSKSPVDLCNMIGILPGFGEKTMDKIRRLVEDGSDIYKLVIELKIKGEKLALIMKLDDYLKDLHDQYENNNNIKMSQLKIFSHSFNLAKILQDNFSQGKGMLENTALIDSAIEEIKRSEEKLIDYRDALTAGLSAINRVDDNKKPAVLLGTAHYAKGGEWDIVICPDLVYGNSGFPSSRNEEKSEEERRICYVAVTRAKHKLYLFSYIYGLDDTPVAQSPYLKEMGVYTVNVQPPLTKQNYYRRW
jgi:superfamily I DNA/RNA helicase